jgi:hypothetical protein
MRGHDSMQGVVAHASEDRGGNVIGQVAKIPTDTTLQ